MLHCDGEAHYIPDYKMTFFAHHDKYELGHPVIETFLAGDPKFNASPVAFPSTLDTKIIRQIENRNLQLHKNNWEHWNLSAIDLPQMMSALGGTITVVNVFNVYIASKENTFVTPNVSCPLMSLIPTSVSNVNTS